MPRLFTGIKIPADISSQLNRLKTGLKDIYWQGSDEDHLTLRFVGDIDAVQADRWLAALEKISAPALCLTLSGVGYFGSRKYVNVLWAGVEANEALTSLQRQHERAAQAAGFAPESRHFTPHITLARPRNLKFSRAALYLQSQSLFCSTTFPVNSFSVFSARSGHGGGPYVEEACFPLEHPAFRWV